MPEYESKPQPDARPGRANKTPEVPAQAQRWPTDAAAGRRRTATMAHRCCGNRIHVPSMSFARPAAPQRCPSDAALAHIKRRPGVGLKSFQVLDGESRLPRAFPLAAWGGRGDRSRPGVAGGPRRGGPGVAVGPGWRGGSVWPFCVGPESEPVQGRRRVATLYGLPTFRIRHTGCNFALRSRKPVQGRSAATTLYGFTFWTDPDSAPD